MKIGIICPYAFDISGGVQIHVMELAKELLARGNYVKVLAPAGKVKLPDYVDSVGRAVPIPYNGSVARLKFSPIAYRKLKKWIISNDFDVLHIHEPTAPSISLLALLKVKGPIVVTFHMANSRSKALQFFKTPIKPFLEKVVGKIAVSDYARQLQMEAFGINSIVIPNGVDVVYYRTAKPYTELPSNVERILFIGRFNEPRKGFEILLEAFSILLKQRNNLELVVIGSGDSDKIKVDYNSSKVKFLGQVSNLEKARWLKSATLYCAPNTGGESFGIILTEALSAGIPIVASDIPAFKSVLADGEAGSLFKNKSVEELARGLSLCLDNPEQRNNRVEFGNKYVQQFAWDKVAQQVLDVYEMSVATSENKKVTLLNEIAERVITVDE